MEVTGLSALLGLLLLLLGAFMTTGAIVGQFRRGVIDELRASLATAQSEIEIQRGRGDRLETAMSALNEKLAATTAENQLLSLQLKTGMRLAPEFQQILTAQMDEYQRRMEGVLKAGWDHRDHQEREALAHAESAIKDLFKEADARVIKRHKTLAEHLPKVTQTALIAALEDE